MAELCAAHGVEFHLAHARQLKAIAHAKVKTDAVDATMLAQLLRTDFLPEAHMVAEELRGPRDLLRSRQRLVERRTSAKNSIARILEKYNHSSAERLPSLARLQMALQREQVGLLDQQVREVEKLLWHELRGDEDVRRLLPIPGIGRVVAMTVRLEVGEIGRFPSERNFFSYCRSVPGASDSGARRRHKPSKAGNRYLKIAFSHAAVRAVQSYPTVRSFYNTKTRKKNRYIARAMVAKELSRIVYHVLSKQTDYNGTFKGVSLKQ